MNLKLDINQLTKSIRLRNITRKKSLILTLAIAFTTLIIGLYGIYYPAKEDIMYHAGIKARIQEKYTLATKVNTLKNKLDYYHNQLPRNNAIDWLMDQILQDAEVCKIKILSITPQPLKEYPPFNVVSVEVNVEGGYHQIGSLIEKIENGDKFIWIDRILLSREELKGRGVMELSTLYPIKKGS